MSKIKYFALKLLFPPALIVVAVSVIGYSSMIYALCVRQHGVLAYIAYAVSAYALVIDVAGFIRLTKKSRLSKRIAHISMLGKSRLLWGYFFDSGFDENTGLCRGMTVNFLYAAFRVVSGIIYASAWFAAIGVYHFIMGIIRVYLIFRYRQRPPDSRDCVLYEYGCCKSVGKYLIALNIPMSAMVFMMVTKNSAFVYPGVIIYASAFYTFYITALAVIRLLRRKSDSPILLASRLINLIAAVMAMFCLQTAMITRFGNGDDGFRRLMNSISGTAVCVAVIAVSVYMIVSAKNKIRKAEKA